MRRAFPVLSCLLALSACSAASKHEGKSAAQKRPGLSAAPTEELLGPARYVLTEGVGVAYDEGSVPSPLPRREAVIAGGLRLLLEHGLVVAEARGPEPLMGFRAIPKRLGGGFFLWSDSRTYRADTFLGELRPIVDIAAEGGVRPWLDTIVLRTDLGLLELDPATSAVRRTALSRFSDVLAASASPERGIRLDLLGRAELTVDGGKTFRDVTAERGGRFFGLEEGRGGEIFLSGGFGRTPSLVLDEKGALGPFVLKNQSDPGWETSVLPFEETTPESRTLAPVDLANAVFAGVRLKGGRALVAREQHLRVLGLASGQLVDDAYLPAVRDVFSHCQPAGVGDDVLLACTHPFGAHVLALGGDPSAPRLEATFSEKGHFVAGLGKRFAFEGRCGANPPSVNDFRGVPPNPESRGGNLFGPQDIPSPEEPESPEEPDAPRTDEAFACVRGDDGAWIERKLVGDDASKLYRMLPGSGGTVTALVFGKNKESRKEEKIPEGVRVIRVDPDDPVLASAAFPALPVVQEEPPYRAIDTDYWLDEKDGSLHGWVLALPKPEGEEEGEDEVGEREPRELVPQGPAGRMLPVSTRLGGPAAGIHIFADGKIEIHALPKGTVEVIRGGRFALARAETEDGSVTYETTDGGKTFRPIEASPLGDFTAAYSDTAVQGCSALGCALGDGVVRLGWGGPAPKKPKEPEALEPANNPTFSRPSPLTVRCEIGPESAKPRGSSTGNDLRSAVSIKMPDKVDIGELRDGTFSVPVYRPFDLGPPRKVTLKAPGVSHVAGDVIPVLLASDTSPAGFFVRADKLRFDLHSSEHAREAIPFAYDRLNVAAAELGGAELVLLDKADGALSLVRGSAIRHLVRFERVPSVTRTRLTLARRIGAKETKLALVTVSAASGDMFLGDLDLERAVVGPLRPIGNVATARACGGEPASYRMLLDVIVDLQGSFDGRPFADGANRTALAQVALAEGKACLEGLEVRSDLGFGMWDMVLRFGPDGGAMARNPGGGMRMTCSIP